MARDKYSTAFTTHELAEKHDVLMPLLLAMFREFQDATKKKPDAVLNKRRVDIVNRLLRDVFVVLNGEKSRTYLDLLDEDDLPQNGDVSLLLGQAVAAMQAFKEKYYGFNRDLLTNAWAVGKAGQRSGS
jgi:hypothetical protein